MSLYRWPLLVLIILLGCDSDSEDIVLDLNADTEQESADLLQSNDQDNKDTAGASKEILEPINLDGVTVIDVGAYTKQKHADLLGVVSGPNPAYNSPTPNLSLSLHDIGMRAVRNTGYFDDRLDMELMFSCPDKKSYPSWDCDPNKDKHFNWEGSDQIFKSWISEGFEPFFRLGGSAVSDVAVHDFKGPQNQSQEDNWINAAKTVTTRYLNWDGKDGRFKYLNIWTEFPNSAYWDRSDDDFKLFWAKAYSSLKDEFEQLLIGGPGFSEKVTRAVMVGSGDVAEQWLNHLYEQKLELDWIGWHLYSNDAQEFLKSAQGYEELLKGVGKFSDVPWAGSGFFDDTEQIVDAWGNTPRMITFGGEWEFMEVPEVNRIYNRKEGAALLTASWIAMQHSPVKRAFYDRFADPKSDPTVDPNADNTLLSMIGGKGLFYGDNVGTYKRSAHAVRLWTRMVDDFSQALASEPKANIVGAAGVQRLWVLSGRTPGGEKAVLVSNPTDLKVQWMVRFGEAKVMANSFTEVVVYQVDSKNDGRDAVNYEGGAFEIPPNSIQLVVLKP